VKKVTDNQHNGELGETLVKSAIFKLGHIFEGRGRLETGVDGTIEFRDPTTGRMLGKTVAVQVKTTAGGTYTREDNTGFEYLVKTEDLEYWSNTNLPVVIILLRLSDQSMYWKDVSTGAQGDERLLKFEKVADKLDAASIDRMAQLSVERGKLGSFVPPMRSGELAHLNLMRIILPEDLFVAESPFKSGRDAVPTLVGHDGRYFDWMIRGRRFVSFRNPRGTGVEKIVEPESIEAVGTEHVALSDDPEDEVIMIELLRRTMEEQFAGDLAYDKETRAFHFRPPEPLVSREYRYRSLKEMTSATVVQLYPDRKKPDRLNNVRHHAFAPRFERIGDDWYVSITPTFFFSENGSRPHRFASILLAGKKRLDRNGSVRGQVLLWRHFLAHNDAGEDRSPSLFNLEPANGPEELLSFESLEPVMMEAAVPEDAWATTDPNAKRMKAETDPTPSLLLERSA
jgi:Domain of unknown function (DUF4365)